MRKRKNADAMHEIKNERRPRVVKDKKEGLCLRKKRKMRRSVKAALTLSLAVVLVFGVYGIGSAFFKDAERNVVNLDYGSVCTAVEEGELFTPDAGYTGVDIFGRLNWTFQQQEKWYGEMHGIVDTVIEQEVSTYKQYDHGILISADLTKSSLISGASQFCYLKDQDLVMWRKPKGGSATYNGVDTEWQTGEPYRSMHISGADGFKATNGLPAYELSVYVIEENTIASASEVRLREDGRYQIDYVLKPETWQEEDENGNLITKGATAYYANQMIFTGGLPEAPVFDAISVSFVFDENWYVYETDIVEKYSAKYGPIAAGCTSTSTTVFEYNTSRAESSAYEDYFINYVDAPVDTAPPEKEVTALNCLAEAFGKVLTEPVSLRLDLGINGERVEGAVDLDLSKTDFAALDFSLIEAKARLGALSLWVEGGSAYLSYGGMKVSLPIEELMGVISELIPSSEPVSGVGEAEAEESEGGSDDLLAALANGAFTVEGQNATLRAELPLLGLRVPLEFRFLLDENKTASLDRVTTELQIDSLGLTAELTFGDEELPALGAEEKAAYPDLIPYAEALIDLFSQDVLHADLAYAGEGVTLSGALDFDRNALALSGELAVNVSAGISLGKTVRFLYADGTVYLELDGIRLSATVQEAIELIERFISLPDLGAGISLDLGDLLTTVLSPDFAHNLSASERDGKLAVALKGTELLRALGIDFDLGDVTIALSDRIEASAFGADVSVAAGEPFPIETDGYLGIMPYVSALLDLFENDNLEADLDFESQDGFAVHGRLLLDLAAPAAQGTVELGYRDARKTVSIGYSEENLYLDLEGIRIKANVQDAIALVGEFVGGSEDPDAMAIVEKLLSLDLGTILSLQEGADGLTITLKGTELLRALGIGFDLDDVVLTVGEGSLSATALGVGIKLEAGEPFVPDVEDYIDILPYVREIRELFRSEALLLRAEYASGDLSLDAALTLNLNDFALGGEVTLAYKDAVKTLGIVYAEGAVILDLDGIRIKADVDEAVSLAKRFVDLPDGIGSEGTDLIEMLFSLDLRSLVTLTEEGDTLSLALAGDKLLEAFGLSYALGEVKITLTDGAITAAVAGATIVLTQGEPFVPDEREAVDLVKYAAFLADMAQGGYLEIAVEYDNDPIKVDGTLHFDLAKLALAGEFTLTYNGIRKPLGVIYDGGTLFLDLDGIRIRAGLSDAIGLVERFLGVPASEDETDLLETLLSLDFGDLVSLKEAHDTLSFVLAGDTLLRTLGVNFGLGEVGIYVKQSRIVITALGARLTVTAGDPFSFQTDEEYLDLVKYVNFVADLVAGGYLDIDVDYRGEALSIDGVLHFGLNDLVLEGDFVLQYKSAQKTLHVVYAEDALFLDFGGIRVKAGLNDALALVQQYLGLPSSGDDGSALLQKLLSLEFGSLISMTEEHDTLSAVLSTDELLRALGLESGIGDAKIFVKKSRIVITALGARFTVTAGDPFVPETGDYPDLVQYAREIAELLAGGYLEIAVGYEGAVKLEGTLCFDLANLKAEGEFVLGYNGIEKPLRLIYSEGTVYLDLQGIRLKASVDDALAFVGRLIELPSDGASIDLSSIDLSALLETLLSLDFEQLLTLSEREGTLSLVLAGDLLLQAFGSELRPGDIVLSLTSGKLTVSAFGARLTVTAGDPFVPDTNGYPDVLPYANSIADMIEGGYLDVAVGYEAKKLSVGGTLHLDLKAPAAAGEFTLTYGSAKKTLTVVYGKEALCLDFDGIRVMANVKEALALVERFVGIPETDGDSAGLLEKLLSLDLSKVAALTEADGALSLVLAGDDLLEALGVQFSLGQVTLVAEVGKLTVSALGATLTVTAGDPFPIDTDGYLDIVRYANTIADMLEKGYLEADLSLKVDPVSISGVLKVGLNPLKAAAELTIAYGSFERAVQIVYGVEEEAGYLYLALEGMRVKANVQETVSMLTALLPDSSEEGETVDFLEKLLSLDFSELLALSEAEGKLELAIEGGALLEAFGITAEKVGRITVSVGDGIEVSALEGDLTLRARAGQDFAVDTVGFVEITDVLQKVPELLSKQALSFYGDLAVGIGGTEIVFEVHRGVVSWKNGFALYLDATLFINETGHDIVLSANGKKVALAYGGVGAELVYEDLPDLETALIDLYHRVRTVIGQAFATEEENPLPEANSLKELLNGFAELLKGGTVATEALGALGDVDLPALLDFLTFDAPTLPNGILSVSYKGFTAELLRALDEDGLIGLVLGYREGDISLVSELHADIYGGELPEMPARDYLGTDDFVELLDDVGAAVALLAEQDLKVTLNGKIRSDAAGASEVKYDLSASVEYHAGGKFPILIDGAEKKITVDGNFYLKLSLALKAKSETDKSIYLDLAVLDGDPDGVKDGKLDFYLSVSYFAPDDPLHDPLTFYAPSGEVMTLLSGVLTMFDVDLGPLQGFLEEYFLSQWLPDLETRASLKAFGGSLGGLLQNLLGGKETESGSGAKAALANAEEGLRGYLASVTREEGALVVVLDGAALYGSADKGDLRLRLEKERDEAGNSFLKFLSLENLRVGDTGVDLNELSIAREETPAEERTGFAVDYRLNGIDSLVLALARSATHSEDVISGEETEHVYTLNKNFYIEGTIDLSAVGLINVTIKLVAISVNIDENGKLAVNIRLEIPGVQEVNQVAINGDTDVDLTIKEGMVYIKRVQKSEWRKVFSGLGTEKHEFAPEEYITLYRAMPLENFTANLLDNVIFIFNFGPLVSDNIKSAGTTDPGTETKEDLGALVKSYLTGFTYRKEGGVEAWNVVLNGASFSNDVIGDLTVLISTDDTGLVRTLHAETSIVRLITVTADLTWRNAGGKMLSGSSDHTTDISEALKTGMSAKLKSLEGKWESVKYLEGQFTTVRFILGSDELLRTQNVVFSTDGTNELYADLNYPSLDKYQNIPGYTYVWEKPTVFTAGMKIYAKPQANEYELVFKSAYPADGFVEEEAFRGTETPYILRMNWKFDTELNLPYRSDERKEIVGFYCPKGVLHKGGEDWHVYDDPVVEFTAKWENISYTVKFVSEGKNVGTFTGGWDDLIGFPATPEREGYRFLGWGTDAETISGLAFGGKRELTLSAQYEANVYRVTLRSTLPVEGFDYRAESGYYEKEFGYEYGTSLALPTGQIDGDQILKGYTLAIGDETYYDTMPKIARDVELYALWEEKGFEVTFDAGESGTFVRYFKRGSTLNNNTPDVPERKGYTGEWEIAEDFVVEGDCTVYAKYTGIVYYITEYSRFYVKGFTEVTKHYESEGVTGERYWQKVYEYTYGDAPHPLTFGESEDVKGYDFNGYFSARFGNEHPEATEFKQIDEEMIAFFDYRVGLETPNAIYANWIDNTVTVNLYSDFDFLGSDGKDEKESAYLRTVEFSKDYEIGYDVEGFRLTPTAEALESAKSMGASKGLVQLAWWYKDEDGWRVVTNVEEFRNDEHLVKANANLYAMWFSAIDVKITQVENQASTYTIFGVMKGGDIIGLNSQAIFDEVGGSRTLTGFYRIYGSRADQSDDLKRGESFEVGEDGVFGATRMTTFNALLWGGAKYGGAVVTVTIDYLGGILSFEKSAIVSLAVSTVTVQDETGATIKQESVRADCPFDEDDNAVYVRDILEGVSLEKTGYDLSWNPSSDTPITGDLVIRPVYSPQLCTVSFTSDLPVTNWTAGADGRYSRTVSMNYDAPITFVIGERTISDRAAFDKAFTLPAAAETALGSRTAIGWRAEITRNGATFTAEYSPDRVVYRSAIAYSFGGVRYEGTEESCYRTEITANTSPIKPTSTGYVFLGWFREEGGAWTKVDTVTLGDEATTHTLSALWMSELKVTITSASAAREGGIFSRNYRYTAETTVTGGQLVGAGAEGYAVSMTFRYYANNNTNAETTNHYEDSKTAYTTSDSVSFTYNDGKKSNVHVAVSIVYSGNGCVFTSDEVYAVKSV